MNCRRCSKELPPGSTHRCPFCGIQQGTYITPRKNPDKYVRPKRSKNMTYSLIAMGVMIAIIAFVLPVFTNINKKNIIIDVNNAYEQNDATMLSIAVAKLKKYKNAEEEIYEAETKLDVLLGLAPDEGKTEEQKKLAEQILKEKLDQLKATCKEEIFAINNFTVPTYLQTEKTSLVFNWTNLSQKTVTEIRLSVYAYDKNDSAIVIGEKAVVNLKSNDDVKTRATDDLAFLDIWDVEVKRIELASVTIIYEDNSRQTLTQDVLQAVFPEIY